MNAAMHEGFLVQSKAHLSTGVDFDELIELEGAICKVYHVNGSTPTQICMEIRG
jgi:hypothetical protein